MNLFKFLFILLALVYGCVDIAPDEEWDNDDTCIWLHYASNLQLEEHWFVEEKSANKQTVLSFKPEYKEEVINQIILSPFYNQTQTIDLSAVLWKEIKRDKIMGIWYAKYNGFVFLQTPGNQYPIFLEIDTIKNQLFVE